MEVQRNGGALLVADGSALHYGAVANGFPSVLKTFDQPRYWVLATLHGPNTQVPVILWGDGDAPRIVPGTKLTIQGDLRPLEPENRSAFAMNLTSLEVHEANTPLEYWGSVVITQLRHTLTEAAESIGGAELVPGFAVGDTTLIDDAIDHVMKESSLTHLVAVSGANCALVITAAMVIAKTMRIGRRSRTFIAGALLAGFVAVVGPDASVERAAIMATVTLVSGFGGKKHIAMPALAIATLAMLLMNPWQAQQAGFALSVAATTGILLLAPMTRTWLERHVRLPTWLSLPLAVTLSAQLACTPLLLLLQPGLPMGGIIANLIAVPVAPFGTGIGLLAMLLLPLHRGAGEAFVWLASWASRWVIATGEMVTDLPLSRWYWPPGVLGALFFVGVVVAIASGVMLLRGIIGLPGGVRMPARRPWHPPRSNPHRVHIISVVFLTTGIGMFLAITVVTPAAEWFVTPRNWALVSCDVGQGDATLIRDPANPELVMLVDTGDDLDMLRDCLEKFGVRRIHTLVLTHDDRDHVGALHAVIDRIDRAVIARPLTGDVAQRHIEEQLRVAAVPSVIGEAGMGECTTLSWCWRVIAPERDEIILDTNAASLVLRIELHGMRLLLLADTGADEHRRMLQRGIDLTADVVKIAHHGSRDHDPELLGASGAQYGLISVGEKNRYGHPHPQTLSDMIAHEVVPLRTDQLGSIALILDGDEVRVWGARVNHRAPRNR